MHINKMPQNQPGCQWFPRCLVFFISPGHPRHEQKGKADMFAKAPGLEHVRRGNRGPVIWTNGRTQTKSRMTYFVLEVSKWTRENKSDHWSLLWHSDWDHATSCRSASKPSKQQPNVCQPIFPQQRGNRTHSAHLNVKSPGSLKCSLHYAQMRSCNQRTQVKCHLSSR